VLSVSPDAELFLYGSRARKTAHEQSDWDILILLNLDSITYEFEKRIIEVLYDIEIETGEIISAMIYTKDEWTHRFSITPLFENISHEGVRLS
jgi:predicted nucleotidyltransferase